MAASVERRETPSKMPAVHPEGGRISRWQWPRVRVTTVALGLAVLATACGGGEDLPQNTLDPAGPLARKIDSLWNLVLVIAIIVFVLVQGALIVSIVKFREKKGAEERKIRQTHGNTRLEIIWTIIPALLLAGIAIPTVATLLDLRAKPEGNVIDIDVIGHQWWWEFSYPGTNVNTANELYMPAGQEVYLTMTSADVIHSFWVPKLNGKRDVVPGRVSNLRLFADEATPDGEPIFGQCAEFCGLAHADMRIRVHVHTQEGYEQWLADQSRDAVIPTAGIAAEGADVYQRVCTACHVIRNGDLAPSAYPLQPDGSRLAPDLTHFASRNTFGGATFKNTTEHLEAWLANPSDLKPMDPDRNDIAAGRILGMPDFGLNERQIDQLVALLQGLE